MRQPNVGPRRGAHKGASKQKKQLMVLGMLGVILCVVLVIQFGGEDEAVAAASAPGGGISVLSGISASQTAGAQPAPVNPGELKPDNEVLVADGDSVRANPFASFWQEEEPEEEQAVEEIVVLPPPTVTLSATLTSGKSPVAYIDGRICKVGDDVGGWTLVQIGSRQISLRSPTGAETTIAMPLLDAGN